MSRKQIGIIIAAGLVFALIFGVRQSVALFIGPLNSATGLGIASVSLAFACAQLMWGITQPIAGAVADKYGTRRVIAIGAALAFVLRGKHPAAAHGAAPEKSMKHAVRDAWNDPSFLLLTAGFFVCGFHVAFIATHLPGVVALCGLPPAVGAWALSLIGLFNIAGSFASGWAIGRWRMKSVLSLLYSARPAALLGFMFPPKTAATFMIFAIVLGFTYLSTVPPTVGLVGKLHGVRYVATLFGIVMLSHQLGGFLGAWLGGQVFERTGSYDWLWYADIMLAIGAALIHLPIKEAPRLKPALAT